MEPNYSKYNLKELREALEFVDRESFPERYTEILKQIDIRQCDLNDGNSEIIKKEPPPKKLPIINKVLLVLFGLYNLYLGVRSIITGKAAGVRGNVYSAIDDPSMFKFSVIFDFLLFALCLYFFYTAQRANKQ